MSIAVVTSMIFFTGLAVLALGLRPRRVGGEPHCGGCEYNLTGVTSRYDRAAVAHGGVHPPEHQPPVSLCPECGTAVSHRSVKWGKKHRRVIMLVLGTLLILIGGSGLYASVDRPRWIRSYPFPIALMFAKNGERDALLELHRRYKNVELSGSATRSLIAEALDQQRLDPAPANLPDWLALLDNFDTGRSFTANQRDQYLAQAFHKVDLEPRSRYRVGERLLASLDLELRCGGLRPIVYVSKLRAQSTFARTEYGKINAFSPVPTFNGPGQQTLKFPAVADSSGSGHVEYQVTLRLSRPNGEPVKKMIELSSSVEIIPLGQSEPVVPRDDAATARRLTSAIDVQPRYSSYERSTGVFGTKYELRLEFQTVQPLVTSLVADVIVCYKDVEFQAGTLVAWKDTKVVAADLDVEKLSLLPSGEATLVLKHNASLIDRTAGLEELFVADLTLGPVRIEWPGAWGPRDPDTGKLLDLSEELFQKRGERMPAEIDEGRPRPGPEPDEP